MFKTRLLSGIVLVILALVLIITGGDVLFASLLIISLIGLYELYRVFQIEKSVIGVAGYAAAVVFYLNLREQFFSDPMILVIGLLTLLMAVYVFSYPAYKTEQALAAFFGVFYTAAMLSYVYQTRMLEQGAYIVWLIFLCSWGSDTCAYCVGVLFGKHKMSPKLSPKKSVEGAAGGIAGSMLLTFLYCFAFQEQIQVEFNEMLIFAVIGGVGALISMVGLSCLFPSHNFQKTPASPRTLYWYLLSPHKSNSPPRFHICCEIYFPGYLPGYKKKR